MHIQAMDAFEVLGAPPRRRILAALRRRPRSVNELVEALGAGQPAVSKHLKVLREAGLIEAERRGTWIYYRSDTTVLNRISALLAAPELVDA